MTVSIDDVLDAVVRVITDLHLTIGTSGPITIVKRKLPVKATDIDQLVPEQLIACPSATPGPVRGYAFRYKEFTHLVDVLLVAPNKNDNIKNLPEYAALFQALLDVFNWPRPGFPRGISSWTLPTRQITARPSELFERRVLEQLKLDLLSIQISATAVNRVDGKTTA